MSIVRHARLPVLLRPLFWDYDFASLRWDKDQDFILGRVLTSGDWKTVTWLRSRMGDATIREWIERHRGGSLSPKRLRLWELILGLPHRQVNAWLASEGRQIWDKRAHPSGSIRRS